MLAAGIAHDLNNILAPITMAVPLLRMQASESSRERLLNTLAQCAERGAGLVRQILDFSRGLGGEMRLVHVEHLLRDIIAVVTETFPKSIAVDAQVAGDLWPIEADPTQIHQVALNLCVNARDAMPTGGTLRLRQKTAFLRRPSQPRSKALGPDRGWLSTSRIPAPALHRMCSTGFGNRFSPPNPRTKVPA